MRTIAILSGKGGVGKTTTSVGVSLALQSLGYRPALLDLDLENPSLGGRDGVTGFTRQDLSFPGDLIEPPRWHGIPVMSISLLPADDFEDAPAMIDEKRKHLMIRQLAKEVNWADTEVLVVDMPPGSGEEVRGLLQLDLDAAIIVTSPQRISEAAVRKVMVMAQKYDIPLLGILENTPNAIDGEAGHRLAEMFRVPLLAQIPWTDDIPCSMEDHVPFNHDLFLPVAQVVADTLLIVEPVTHTRRTPEEIDALIAADLEEAKAVTTSNARRPDLLEQRHPAVAASEPGIYVGPPEDDDPIAAVEPWRVFAEFTDEEWVQIQPLLPAHMRTGRKRVDDRALLNGVFWVYTTRNRWEDMPAKYGNSDTAKSRVKRWKEQELWAPILEKARSFGYAMTEGDFFDDSNDHEEVLHDGDGSGQQEWVGPEVAGQVPASGEAEHPDQDLEPAAQGEPVV